MRVLYMSLRYMTGFSTKTEGKFYAIQLERIQQKCGTK